MRSSQRALGRSKTLGELTGCQFCQIISKQLLSMTGFTERSGAPAPPRSNGAAELALEQQEIGSVSGTKFGSRILAACAEELGRITMKGIEGVIVTTLHTTCKERFLTAH